jgi:cytochrome c-type biogenesis protein CcmH/NrfG
MRLGGARGHAGDLTGAIVAFQQVLELDPQSATGHVNLGLALEAAGRIDGAIEAYERAVRLEPANARAAELLATAQSSRRGSTAANPAGLD